MRYKSMYMDYWKWRSPHLGQDMEMKAYGKEGKPVLVFPSEGGRFYEYEDFGMVEECRPFIEKGLIHVFTVDSVDRQAIANRELHPSDRIRRHDEYEKYIVEEVVPFIRNFGGRPQNKLLVTGCSMGGYQSANFFFRHPELADALIAQSGIYRLNLFMGDYMDDAVYHHTPLAYLPNLTDPKYLEQYKKSQIIISVGQGAWEHPMLEETLELKKILETKHIPAWVDVWGHDVAHDWPWWRRQIPYFLDRIKF